MLTLPGKVALDAVGEPTLQSEGHTWITCGIRPKPLKGLHHRSGRLVRPTHPARRCVTQPNRVAADSQGPGCAVRHIAWSGGNGVPQTQLICGNASVGDDSRAVTPGHCRDRDAEVNRSWSLQNGAPSGCVIEPVSDPPEFPGPGQTAKSLIHRIGAPQTLEVCGCADPPWRSVSNPLQDPPGNAVGSIHLSYILL